MVAGGVGNGGHVHLSVWRDGGNLFAGGDGRHGLTADGEAFAAGVLAHLLPLLAIGAPTPASYLRLVPSHWAGAYAVLGPRDPGGRAAAGHRRADAASGTDTAAGRTSR